jgi:hypothetical protein
LLKFLEGLKKGGINRAIVAKEELPQAEIVSSYGVGFSLFIGAISDKVIYRSVKIEKGVKAYKEYKSVFKSLLCGFKRKLKGGLEIESFAPKGDKESEDEINNVKQNGDKRDCDYGKE